MTKTIFVLICFLLSGCLDKSQIYLKDDRPFQLAIESYNHSDMSFTLSNTLRTKYKYMDKDFSSFLEPEIAELASKLCGIQKHEYISSEYKKTIVVTSHQEAEYPYYHTLTKILVCK